MVRDGSPLRSARNIRRHLGICKFNPHGNIEIVQYLESLQYRLSRRSLHGRRSLIESGTHKTGRRRHVAGNP